jgi:hypothetical protein
MLTTALIRHAPSKTIFGGYNGVVWIVRALILVLLNFDAVNGDLTPPHDPPSRDYDLSVLPLDELPHVLSWCREFIEAIRTSINILAKTSDARKSYASEIASVPLQDPVSAPAPLPIPPLATSTLAKSRSHKATGGPSRKSGKTKQTKTPREPMLDEESGTHSSGESDGDRDYDALDRNSDDDDDDLDPNGYLPDLPGRTDDDSIDPSLNAQNDYTAHEDHADGARTFGHPSPRLPEECAEIFQPGM